MAITLVPRDAKIIGIASQDPPKPIPGGERIVALTSDKVRITIDDIMGNTDLIVTHPDDFVIDVDRTKKTAHVHRR